MAEIVELRSEQMIPELEQMEKMQIFEKNEIKAIIKKREDFEYKLAIHRNSQDDVLKYIQYEMDLLKLIRQKRNDKGLVQKSNNKIDIVIVNHINQLYCFAIRKFSSEARIWLSYVKFCTQVRFHSCASRVLDQMLALHQNKPSLFKIAAQWEFDEHKCVERARRILLLGLHAHKDSKLLYKEAFLLELNYAQQKRRELTEAGDKIDETDNVLSGKGALVVYESAINQINDVDFVVDLLKSASDYPFTKELQQKILEDLMENYPSEELTWDTRARRELDVGQSADTPDSSRIPLKERIANCQKVYEMGVRQLNTERMWAMYIDKMLELYKEASSLPNMMKNYLKKAFNGAHMKGMMSERYYLLWMDHLKSSEKGDKVYEVLVKGTEKLPGSVTLWGARLKYHLTRGEEEQANKVFRESIAGLGDASLLVWKLMLQFQQNANPSKAEDLFREGIVLTPGISSALKPLYLEWLTISRGIAAARKVYVSMAQSVPHCLEMHLKMAELEDMQPTLSLKHARKCHQLTCTQFGSTNTDVWMNYVKFEQTYGNAELIPEIHARALKSLKPPNLVDIFVSEFSLSKAESFSTVTATPTATVHMLPKYDRVEEQMDTS